MRDKPRLSRTPEQSFCVSAVQVVINEEAGRVGQIGRQKLEDMIIAAFGPRVAGIHFVRGKAISRTLAEILDHPADAAVLLGGGDGTVRACGQMFLNKPVFLGILPLGTMNLLAHDLGIPEDFGAALRAYQNCQTLHIDCGTANGHVFLCNAVIGVVPEASLAREEARRAHSLHESLLSWSAVLSTVLGGLHTRHKRRFFVKTGKRRRALYANALIVANNGYIKNPRRPHERLRRNTLTDGKLVIYSAGPASPWGSFRLLLRLLWGSWQKDPSIHAFNAREAMIDDLNENSLVSLDGEPVRLAEPLHFRIMPEALPVLVPAERAIV